MCYHGLLGWAVWSGDDYRFKVSDMQKVVGHNQPGCLITTATQQLVTSGMILWWSSAYYDLHGFFDTQSSDLLTIPHDRIKKVSFNVSVEATFGEGMIWSIFKNGTQVTSPYRTYRRHIIDVAAFGENPNWRTLPVDVVSGDYFQVRCIYKLGGSESIRFTRSQHWFGINIEVYVP